LKLAVAHRVDFKAIKEAASFETVLAFYNIQHRGRGDQRKALCPFHNDTKPSLNVNLRKKVFNCYPCGDGGDIIKFVAKKEYPADPDGHRMEAAEKLAEICGIPITGERSHAPASDRARRSSFHTMSVSPLRANSSASCNAGRSVTAPDICSVKIFAHLASVSASRCKARFWSTVDTRA
jgi:CHC2 zinc finger